MDLPHSERTIGLKRTACLAFLLGCIVAPAIHAAGPGLPPSPGAVSQPFRPELTLPDSPAPEIETREQEQPSAPDSKKTIEINQFKIRGNTSIPTSELLNQISDLEGSKLTLQDIYTAADILTTYYHDHGYILTRVVVPAQQVTFGIVELQVIEGKISGIQVQGNDIYDTEFLKRQINDELPQGEILTRADMESELLLLNDLPGLNAKAVLKPGPEFGTTDMVLDVEEQRFNGLLSVNNYGRESIGEWRLDGQLQINNPIGLGDKLVLSLTGSEQNLLRYFGLGYAIPVNTRGTALSFDASIIDYDVGGDFDDLDIEGKTRYYKLTATHPIIRTRRNNLLLGAGVEYNTVKTKTLGLTTRDEHLWLMELSAIGNYTHQDNAISSYSAMFAGNFKNNEYGLTNNAQAGKFSLMGTHLRKLYNQWHAFFRGNVVYSIDPLMDLERFFIGGPNSVRGFPSAEVGGDRGFDFSAEIRRYFVINQSITGNAKLFFDAGKVYRIEPFPGQDSTQSLSSVGVGVAFEAGQHARLNVQYAIPTDDFDSSDGRRNRFWLNLSAVF